MAMLTPALSPDTSLRSGSHEHVSAVPTFFPCGSSAGPNCAASGGLRSGHGSSPATGVAPAPSPADALVRADDAVGWLLATSLTRAAPPSLVVAPTVGRSASAVVQLRDGFAWRSSTPLPTAEALSGAAATSAGLLGDRHRSAARVVQLAARTGRCRASAPP